MYYIQHCGHNSFSLAIPHRNWIFFCHFLRIKISLIVIRIKWQTTWQFSMFWPPLILHGKRQKIEMCDDRMIYESEICIGCSFFIINMFRILNWNTISCKFYSFRHEKFDDFSKNDFWKTSNLCWECPRYLIKMCPTILQKVGFLPPLQIFKIQILNVLLIWLTARWPLFSSRPLHGMQFVRQ